MNSIQACFLIGLILGALLAGVGVYKWEEAAKASELERQIAADNKALQDMEKRAMAAEGALAQSKSEKEKLMAEREKERAQHPATCKPDADTVKWLHSVTTAPPNLPR